MYFSHVTIYSDSSDEDKMQKSNPFFKFLMQNENQMVFNKSRKIETVDKDVIQEQLAQGIQRKFLLGDIEDCVHGHSRDAGDEHSQGGHGHEDEHG